MKFMHSSFLLKKITYSKISYKQINIYFYWKTIHTSYNDNTIKGACIEYRYSKNKKRRWEAHKVMQKINVKLIFKILLLFIITILSLYQFGSCTINTSKKSDTEKILSLNQILLKKLSTLIENEKYTEYIQGDYHSKDTTNASKNEVWKSLEILLNESKRIDNTIYRLLRSNIQSIFEMCYYHYKFKNEYKYGYLLEPINTIFTNMSRFYKKISEFSIEGHSIIYFLHIGKEKTTKHFGKNTTKRVKKLLNSFDQQIIVNYNSKYGNMPIIRIQLLAKYWHKTN